MKRFILLAIVLMLAVFLASRGSQSSGDAQEKEDFQAKIQARLERVRERIEALSPEAEKVGAEAVTQLSDAIGELEIQEETVKGQLEELGSPTAESWEKFRPSIEQSMDELEQNYQQAYQQVTEARLKQLEDQIEALRAEAEQAGVAMSPELAEMIGELQSQRQELAELNEAGTAAWGDIHAGLEAALTELEKAYQRALTRFEETS